MPAASDRTPPFEVRRSSIQGRGAFATRTIRKGARIIEYTGERITDEEADRRYVDDAMERHHTFLFSLDDGTNVDAAVGGNDARYINHSCEPNCEAVIEDGHIYVDALRTIRPGEELLYDYAYEREDDSIDPYELYPCRCGAPSCRGTIMKVKVAAKKTPAAKRKRSGAKKKDGAPSKRSGSSARR